MRVMVIENEEVYARMAATIVEDMGGTCAWMTNTKDALEDLIAAKPPYQAVILDRLLEEGGPDDSLHLIETLKTNCCHVPVIVASALGERHHETEAAIAGADGYIRKPYQAIELQAKLQVATRNYRKTVYQNLELDLQHKDAYWQGKSLQLDAKQFGILLALGEADGKPVHRIKLHDAVWPHQATYSVNRIDSAIKRLRQNLNLTIEDGESIVELVKKFGYRLNTEFLGRFNTT